MPVIQIETAEGLRLRTELAGVGSRMAAALLDLLIAGAGLVLLLFLLLAVGFGLDELGMGLGAGVAELLAGVLIGGGLFLGLPLYFAIFQQLWAGQTPGKRAVGLRVVSDGGAPASLSAHLLRSFIFLVDLGLMMPAPLGLLLIGIHPRCRRLGDLAAGTFVICEPSEGRDAEPWPGERWSERESRVLDLSPGMVSRLSDGEIALLRDAITRRGLERPVMKRLHRDLVGYFAERVGFQPAGTERQALKELYLFARELRRA